MPMLAPQDSRSFNPQVPPAVPGQATQVALPIIRPGQATTPASTAARFKSIPTIRWPWTRSPLIVPQTQAAAHTFAAPANSPWDFTPYA